MPLLLEIIVSGDEQFFILGSKATSAYPSEKEVVLQDGAVYEIKSCSVVERVDPNDQVGKRLNKVVLEKKREKYAVMSWFQRNLNLLID